MPERKPEFAHIRVAPLPNDIRQLAALSDDTGLAHRYALHTLNPFTILGLDYSRFNTDGSLDLYNPATRTGTLTESWLEDRAEMLALVANRSLSPFSEYRDLASGVVQSGTDPDYLPINQVIFGSAAGERITGQFTNDRLYGGAGDYILDGSVGNDYLEGGLGKDTYMLSTASNSGIDTIFDADGQGVLSVNGTELTHLAFQRPNIPIADGNVGEAYYSADSLYRLREGEDGW